LFVLLKRGQIVIQFGLFFSDFFLDHFYRLEYFPELIKICEGLRLKKPFSVEKRKSDFI